MPIDIISGHSGPASEFLDAHNNPDEFDFALLQCLANSICKFSGFARTMCADYQNSISLFTFGTLVWQVLEKGRLSTFKLYDI